MTSRNVLAGLNPCDLCHWPGSIIPSVQNLLLAARALGVGGTITTLHASVEDQVHELFGIPETAQIGTACRSVVRRETLAR